MYTNLFYTIANFQTNYHAMGTVRDNPEKVSRTLAFFECLWACLLYTALIENLSQDSQDRYTHNDFANLNRPSMGNYIAMLRVCLNNRKGLAYTSELRNILRKKQKSTDALPLRLVSEEIFKALNKDSHHGDLNLINFFGLIIELRNNYQKHKSVTEETMIQIVAKMEETHFIDKLLAEFEPLTPFQMGYVTSPQQDGPQRLTLLKGADAIGVHTQTFDIDTPLSPKTLYLLHISQDDNIAEIIGSAFPFFIVEKSKYQHARLECFQYQSASESKQTYRLDYMTHLTSESHELTGNKADNPLTKVIAQLTDQSNIVEHPAEPKTGKIRKPKSGKAAYDTQETGQLQIKFLPPKVGVNVTVLDTDDYHPPKKTISQDKGLTDEIILPKSTVIIEATYNSNQAQQHTQVIIKSDPIEIEPKEKKIIAMALPNSLPYDEAHQKFIQHCYDAYLLGCRNWKFGLYLTLTAFIMLLVGTLIYQHFFMSAPKGMIYISKANYTPGLVDIKDDSFNRKANDLLKIISKFVHGSGINVALAAERFFINKPHVETLDAFYIDKSEVTVGAYQNYMARRQVEMQTETSVSLHALTPNNWEKQLERAAIKTPIKEYPVHGVTWDQASNYCKYNSGQLPTSDEWEVAARNLTPNDPNGGTLYPWGYVDGNDIFIPGITQTSERFENQTTEVCKLEDKNQQGVCDLGGNLSEWTRTPYHDEYIIRGQRYNDQGEIGALGYMTQMTLPKSYEGAEVIGFRCVYHQNVDQKAGYPGGAYHLGYPEDPRLKLFTQHPEEAENLLEKTKEPTSIGDFYIMQKKVTNAEYEAFYQSSDHGKGPWSQSIGEPIRFKHIPPPKGGRPDEPVLGVSWYSAHGYCASKGMRLPTADEWERIVRGERGWLFPWGMEDDTRKCEKFLHPGPKPDHPMHSFILSMWTDGQEWTRSTGWDEDNRRLLKGPSDASRKGTIAYLTTKRQPAKADEHIARAGFRCVMDRNPCLSERLFGDTSKRLKDGDMEWDPTHIKR